MISGFQLELLDQEARIRGLAKALYTLCCHPSRHVSVTLPTASVCFPLDSVPREAYFVSCVPRETKPCGVRVVTKSLFLAVVRWLMPIDSRCWARHHHSVQSVPLLLLLDPAVVSMPRLQKSCSSSQITSTNAAACLGLCCIVDPRTKPVSQAKPRSSPTTAWPGLNPGGVKVPASRDGPTSSAPYGRLRGRRDP